MTPQLVSTPTPNQGIERVKRRIMAARAAGWDEADIQRFAIQDIKKQRGITTPDTFGTEDSSKTSSEQARKYVFDKASKDYGWGPEQLNALNSLVTRESGWDPTASNPSSKAFGLFQFVPMHWGEGKYLPKGSKSSLAEQTAGGLKYIAQRYGSPTKALNFWLSRRPINGRDVGNWY